MAHVVHKTLRNVASHEKITMPWVPTPNRIAFNQVPSLHSAPLTRAVSVSNQEVTLRNCTERAGNSVWLVSEPLVALSMDAFSRSLLKQRSVPSKKKQKKSVLKTQDLMS